MPELFEVFDRLKATSREYRVIADAVDQRMEEVAAGRGPAPPGTSLQDYASARARLEDTYIVRLWAEFETALRSYRRSRPGKQNDQIRTRDLIDWAEGVSEGRKIAAGVKALVHQVRDYRNGLVHDREATAPAVPIEEARHRLTTFLARLPARW